MPLSYSNTLPKILSRIPNLLSHSTSKGNIVVGNGALQVQRGPNLQQAFTQKLIEIYDSDGGVELERELRCPILCNFLPRNQMKAAHTIPISTGQETMDHRFGRGSEMFEPETGWLISKVAARNISCGFMAIVPNIPDVPSREGQEEWSNAKIKSYKLEIINPHVKGAVLPMPPFCEESDGKPSRWTAQHGRVLEFKSEFRPRARYLWWQWAISHLRKMWQDLSDHQLPECKQIHRPYWGTAGSYVRPGPLSAIAEEVGTKFDTIMEAAMSPEEEEVVAREAGIDDGIGALLTVEHHLTETRPVDDEEEEDVPDTDDEDEDEDDDDIV